MKNFSVFLGQHFTLQKLRKVHSSKSDQTITRANVTANQLHLIVHYSEPLAAAGSYANEGMGDISRLAEYLWLNLKVDLGAE